LPKVGQSKHKTVKHHRTLIEKLHLVLTPTPTCGKRMLAVVNFCQMKIGLELVIHEEPDGRKFLNYWDWKHGNDICCQIIDGELLKSEYDEEGNELPKKEISFADFVKLVEAVV